MADYAGAGSRIVAVIIDHIILIVIAMIVALPLGLYTAMSAIFMDVSGILAPTLLATVGILNVVIWILYFTYFEGSSGQTLGKRVMGIRVTRIDGTPPSYGEAFLRTILRIIDGIGAYILGLIVILATEKKQRIGDMAAKTIVVKA